MSESLLNLRYLAHPVTTLGPGKRVALWTAGCSLACPGCISPQLQDPAAGRLWSVARVVRRILDIGGPFDGLTLTGGEPFEQPAALVQLTRALKLQRPGWNLLTYSGYTLKRLLRLGPPAQELLSLTDVLIAGPYRAERPQNHPLAGSGNQQIHYLSEMGRQLRPACEALLPNRAELASGRRTHLLVGILSQRTRSDIHLNLGIDEAREPPTRIPGAT